MRVDPVKIITNGDMSQASVTSIGVNINQMFIYAIQAVFTGSPVGAFKIQVSCDNVLVSPSSDPSANVVNWTDYTGSAQSISAAGNFAWIIDVAPYLWVRLVYTKTSGTGTLNATLNGKG